MKKATVIVEKNSANKKGEEVFGIKKLSEILNKHCKSRRFVYAPIKTGKYTQKEYDTFVRNHAAPSSKKKKPDWRPGDEKPVRWKIVIECESREIGDKVWRWFMAKPEDCKIYPDDCFDSYAKKLVAVEKAESNSTAYDYNPKIAKNDKQIDVTPQKGTDQPQYDPYAEGTENIAKEMVSVLMTNTALGSLARQNIYLQEENRILRSRLIKMQKELDKTLAIMNHMDTAYGRNL